jgi:hypothetical protein
MDVALESFGYATEHPMFSPHWRPAAQVKVALVTRATQTVVYQEKFMYGYHNPLMSGTNLDASEIYRFKNREALIADESRLVAGLGVAGSGVRGQAKTTPCFICEYFLYRTVIRA